jgi:YbbR domain-containing protein
MKKLIFNNFSLKLIALISGFVLWAMIVNVYDPKKTVTVSNVSVVLENESALTEKGYTYSVVDGGKISVTLSGPLSIISEIKASDIVAKADLSEMSAYSNYADIHVTVMKNGRKLTGVTVTPNTSAVELDIENRKTQEFSITLTTSGTPESGYTISNESITPSLVKITGPTSKIDSISRVRAIYDVSNVNSDINDQASIMLYDVDGNVISVDNLTLSETEVVYTATVKQTKSVPLKVVTSGSVANGYTLGKVTPSTASVNISGAKSVLDNIQEFAVPSSVLNVDGLKEDTTFRIWLSDYAPEGVSMVTEDMITINVQVIDNRNKTVDVALKDIKIEGLAENLTATLTGSALKVVLTGEIPDGTIQPQELNPVVSLSGVTVGEKQLPVTFTAPSGVTISGSYSVTVNVKEK